MSSVYYGGSIRMNPEPEMLDRDPMFEEGYPHKVPKVYLEGHGEAYFPQYCFDWDDDSVVVVRDRHVVKYTRSSFVELLAKNESGEIVWMDGRCAPYSDCWDGEYLNEYRGGQEYTIEEYDLDSCKKRKYKIVLDEESEMNAHDYSSLSNFVDADKLGNYFDIQDGVLTRYVGKDTDLIIPEGVTEVSGDPFWCEKEFKTIVIPSTLVKISDSMFARCKVKEITVAEGNTQFYSKDGCLFDKELGALIWGYAATSIPENAEISSVGERAFYGRKDLDRLVIPDNITEVGSLAFAGCSNMKSVTFSNANCVIGAGCFSNCTLLSVVELPNMLNEIKNNTFDYCDALQTLEIPASVQVIDRLALGRCENLKKINISDDLIESLENNLYTQLVRKGDGWEIEEGIKETIQHRTLEGATFGGFIF